MFPVAPFDIDLTPVFIHLRRSYQISFVYRKGDRSDLRDRLASAARLHQERSDLHLGAERDTIDLQDALDAIVKDNDSIQILGRGRSKSLREVFLPPSLHQTVVVLPL